jgi:hypothetical protein
VDREWSEKRDFLEFALARHHRAWRLAIIGYRDAESSGSKTNLDFNIGGYTSRVVNHPEVHPRNGACLSVNMRISTPVLGQLLFQPGGSPARISVDALRER